MRAGDGVDRHGDGWRRVGWEIGPGGLGLVGVRRKGVSEGSGTETGRGGKGGAGQKVVAVIVVLFRGALGWTRSHCCAGSDGSA